VFAAVVFGYLVGFSQKKNVCQDLRTLVCLFLFDVSIVRSIFPVPHTNGSVALDWRMIFISGMVIALARSFK